MSSSPHQRLLSVEEKERALALLGVTADNSPPLDRDVALSLCKSMSHSPVRVRRDRLPAMDALLAWLGTASSYCPPPVPAARGSFLAPTVSASSYCGDATTTAGAQDGRVLHSLSPCRERSLSPLTDDEPSACLLFSEAELQHHHRSVSAAAAAVFDRAAALKLLEPSFDRDAALALLAPCSNKRESNVFDRQRAFALLLPSVVQELRNFEASHAQQCEEAKKGEISSGDQSEKQEEEAEGEEEEDHAARFNFEQAIALLAPSRSRAASETEERNAAFKRVLSSTPRAESSECEAASAKGCSGGGVDENEEDEREKGVPKSPAESVHVRDEEMTQFEFKHAIALLAPSVRRIRGSVADRGDDSALFRLLLPTQPPQPPAAAAAAAAPTSSPTAAAALHPQPEVELDVKMQDTGDYVSIPTDSVSDDTREEPCYFDRCAAVAMLAPSTRHDTGPRPSLDDSELFCLLLPSPPQMVEMVVSQVQVGAPAVDPQSARTDDHSVVDAVVEHQDEERDEAAAAAASASAHGDDKQELMSGKTDDDDDGDDDNNDDDDGDDFDRCHAVSLLAPSVSSGRSVDEAAMFQLLLPSHAAISPQALHDDQGESQRSATPEPQHHSEQKEVLFDRESAVKLLAPSAAAGVISSSTEATERFRLLL